ncbi:MAG TPA: sigma-70 family RNA polymerase sigma factor [Verrucomicrobiales bacterium]|nr:sigma-70 family RNA polymerase sigma factor [Verrucomicrobiales bacterium]
MSEEPASEWETWIAENASRFLLFARQQTRSEQDAEDVLQDSLVESWQRSGGKPEPALVFATIRRRAIDLGRRHDRRTRREEASAPENDVWFDSAVNDRETAMLLEEAVRTLPKELAEVITLKVWGGQTFAEVAATLGIPQGTAATRYRTALSQLRKSLTPVLL